MGQVKRGQLKLGHVEGGVLGLHFATEDGEQFAITNVVRVNAEQMSSPPSWATFLPFHEIRGTGGWRIDIEAQQLAEDPQETAGDYDYDLEAEELPDLPQALPAAPVRVLERPTEKPPCGG